VQFPTKQVEVVTPVVVETKLVPSLMTSVQPPPVVIMSQCTLNAPDADDGVIEYVPVAVPGLA
jgi:hypothetical protein